VTILSTRVTKSLLLRVMYPLSFHGMLFLTVVVSTIERQCFERLPFSGALLTNQTLADDEVLLCSLAAFDPRVGHTPWTYFLRLSLEHWAFMSVLERLNVIAVVVAVWWSLHRRRIWRTLLRRWMTRSSTDVTSPSPRTAAVETAVAASAGEQLDSGPV